MSAHRVELGFSSRMLEPGRARVQADLLQPKGKLQAGQQKLSIFRGGFFGRNSQHWYFLSLGLAGRKRSENGQANDRCHEGRCVLHAAERPSDL
jgi:hypothetical protein